MQRISGIYKIINSINNKYYIGSGKDLLGFDSNGRKYQHFYALGNKSHHCKHLQRAYNKHGKENFSFVIIEKDIPENQLLIVEQKYLDIAKLEKEKVYNSSFVAGKIEMTEEIRRKISKKFLSNKANCPMFGKKHSEETKIKIGNASKGRFFSKETRAKMSKKQRGKNNGMYGRKHSKVTRQKIKKSIEGNNIGPLNPRYDKTIYDFKNMITNEKFSGTKHDFYTNNGLVKSGVYSLINGKLKTLHGWVYLPNQ